RQYSKIESYLIENSILIPLFHEIDYRVSNPRVRKMTLRGNPPYVNYSELGKSEVTSPVQKKSEGGMIHVPIGAEITSLDPTIASGVLEAEVFPMMFETLTRETEGARIIPWLASAFYGEDGGRAHRFRLRDDIRFHDGRRVTARDVRYSFEYLLKNKESTYRWFLAPIQGAKE